MADLGEEAFSSQMKVVATFLRLLEELMRNKQQDLRYGTKTQRRGILGQMKDFVGGIFKKVYDGTFGRLSRNGKDYGQLDLNDPAVAKLFADTMKQSMQTWPASARNATSPNGTRSGNRLATCSLRTVNMTALSLPSGMPRRPLLTRSTKDIKLVPCTIIRVIKDQDRTNF